MIYVVPIVPPLEINLATNDHVHQKIFAMSLVKNLWTNLNFTVVMDYVMCLFFLSFSCTTYNSCS